MMFSLQMMYVCQICVPGGLFVLPCLIMFCCFAIVLCSMLMVLSRLLVMLEGIQSQ